MVLPLSEAWVMRDTQPYVIHTGAIAKLIPVQNGMQAPGAAIALVFSIALAYSSDRFRERGIHIAVAMLLAFGGCFWLALAPANVGRRVLYVGYLLTAGTMGTGQAINAVSHPSGFRDSS
jgi:hypothetical protein